MIDALRYEWVRLWSIRSTYWLIGLAIGIQLLLTLIIAWQLPSSGPLSGGDDVFAVLVTIGASLGFAPLFIAYILGLVGVFSMGHEYRHGMIRATLTALPNRLMVLVAKVVVAALVAGTAAAACVLIAVLAAQLFGVDMPTGDGFWSITAGTVIYTMLFTVSGLAFAAITRHQTAAVALLLLVPTVVEAIIGAVVLAIKFGSDDPTAEGGFAELLKFLPYDAGGQMYTRLSIDRALEIFGIVPFGPVGGGVVMASFVAILLAISTALFLRRDA
jgi:hypothetical protein